MIAKVDPVNQIRQACPFEYRSQRFLTAENNFQSQIPLHPGTDQEPEIN